VSFEEGGHCPVGRPILAVVSDESITIEAHQTVGGAQPNEATRVARNALSAAGGQTVGSSVNMNREPSRLEQGDHVTHNQQEQIEHPPHDHRCGPLSSPVAAEIDNNTTIGQHGLSIGGSEPSPEFVIRKI